jgi:outer membrane lipoprotein-sorting protein
MFALLIVSVSGCTTSRVPSPTSPTLAALTTLPTAQELLNRLETRRQTLTSLRGLARITYKDANDKGSAKQAIAVAAPDRFRWELFSPIGVAALIASNGTQLSTYFPGEKVLYRGDATTENVARFTRVALSPREIVGLLLGAPVLPPAHQTCTVRADTDHNWIQLTCLNRGQEGVSLWFEPRTSNLRRVETSTATGAVTKRMELAEYRAVGGNTFPFEIVLYDVQNQQQASIFYERVELNPRPADAIFTLASISGVREAAAEAFPP